MGAGLLELRGRIRYMHALCGQEVAWPSPALRSMLLRVGAGLQVPWHALTCHWALRSFQASLAAWVGGARCGLYACLLLLVHVSDFQSSQEDGGLLLLPYLEGVGSLHGVRAMLLERGGSTAAGLGAVLQHPGLGTVFPEAGLAERAGANPINPINPINPFWSGGARVGSRQASGLGGSREVTSQSFLGRFRRKSAAPPELAEGLGPLRMEAQELLPNAA